MLDELRKLLPECDDNVAHLWIDYLSALRELYSVLVRPTLDDDFSYEDKFEQFETAFEAVHNVWGLPETVKIHILTSHTLEYLTETGETLSKVNDEHLERAHQKVRYFETRHNHRVTKNKVGAHKQKRSLSCISSYNSFNKRKKRNSS